jgi:hypothetical protein
MRLLASVALSLLICAFPLQAKGGGITIRLKKSWVEKYENAILIKADDFVVDRAHAKPNPASKDGDLHIAGRANSTVSLPVVAEISNAKLVPKAVDMIHEAEGTEEAIPLQGVWRLWCEHSGISSQDQSKEASPATTTNPDHVFEIHPVTKVGNLEITKATFKPIIGFNPKDAAAAFGQYEGIPCEIQDEGDYVSIHTKMAGYNYVRFAACDVRDLQDLDDGISAFATVKVADADAEEPEYLVKKVRVVAVKGTTAATALRKAADNHMAVTVIGIPRISLKLVSSRVKNADAHQERLAWDLPYEVIVMTPDPAKK